MTEPIVAWKTAVLSVFGQFMRGKNRSALSASLVALAAAALAGFGLQEGAARLSVVGTMDAVSSMQDQASTGAKVLTLLLAGSFLSWLLVEFLPRSDWISIYLGCHQMRPSARLAVAATKIAVYGGIAVLMCGPALALSVGGLIGVSAPEAMLMTIVVMALGVCWARLYHSLWRYAFLRSVRGRGLGSTIAEVATAVAVSAVVIVGLGWPWDARGHRSLLWLAWESHWLEGLLVASAAAVVAGGIVLDGRVDPVARTGKAVMEWRPASPFPVLRLVLRMVFRARQFRQMFGEAAAVALVGLAVLAAITYSQRSLVAGHATVIVAAAAGSLPLIVGRVIGPRPHLVCLAVSDRLVESLALATVVCAGLPVMLTWSVGTGLIADWRMAASVPLPLWAAAVGLGSLWWFRWVDGRRLSRAALMGAACAVYGAQVLLSAAFGALGLPERAVSWAVLGSGVTVLAAVVGLRGVGAGGKRALVAAELAKGA